MGEDEGDRLLKDLDKVTKSVTDEIDTLLETKQKEIMEADSDQVRRIMERNEQPHEEAEETLDQINKKTGRNMPQAIATGAALVILIVACLLLSVDLFVLLVVVFMILALWELRVDFATVGLHLPGVLCCGCARPSPSLPPTIPRTISSRCR